MNLKPWLPFGAVLLICVAIFCYGYWLALDAAYHLNRLELRLGLAVMLPGALLASGLLARLLNRLPSERKRLAENRQRNRPAALSFQIKKREKSLRRMQFLKRHPSVVFLFILTALAVLTAMALCPDSMGKRHDVVLLHVIGIVFGLAYVVAMIFFLYALITKKWGLYMDESIRMLEARLEKAKSAQTQL